MAAAFCYQPETNRNQHVLTTGRLVRGDAPSLPSVTQKQQTADFMGSKTWNRTCRRIHRLREQHGWTQVEMADKVGLDRSFLADVERGKRNISVRNLYLIAKGFKKTLSQLLSGV